VDIKRKKDKKKKDKSSSSSSSDEKKIELSFVFAGNPDVKASVIDKLALKNGVDVKVPVLDIDKKKVQILPSIDKLQAKIENSIEKPKID
jgi:hypothetical protein